MGSGSDAEFDNRFFRELTVVIPCLNERHNVGPLVKKLHAVLSGIRWEAVFVDDDSPDGTASAVRQLARDDDHIRCIRRIGRRGLASAVIEGVLSSSADYVAVIDGDLQHDVAALPKLLSYVKSGTSDVAIASRYLKADHASGLANNWRQQLSSLGNRLVRLLLPVTVQDPMSGYFVTKRALFEELAPRLTGHGFKILLDLLLSSPRGLKVTEVPVRFLSRVEGESKLNVLVMTQFIGLIVDKLLRGAVPLRFITFSLVGAFGVFVNLAIITVGLWLGWDFFSALVFGTAAAMISNFYINNELTYRDQRLRGNELWLGLLLFMLVCSVGAFANVGVAHLLFQANAGWSAAGACGAAIGVVWNYAVSSTLVWNSRRKLGCRPSRQTPAVLSHRDASPLTVTRSRIGSEL